MSDASGAGFGIRSGRTTAPRRHTSWSDWLAPMLFLGLGLGLILPKYITGAAMPGDLGDARFNLAVLEVFYRSLVHLLHGRGSDFLNAPFFYPWPRVTNFSDTLWGDGPVYALARALGADPLGAFRAWFVAGFALTYAAAFLSFRKLRLGAWGAAAGAFLFTFPLPMTAQFSHAQLIYRLWVPPAVVALDRLLTRRSLRAGAACLLFLALQLLASIYIGLFLFLLLIAYGVASYLVGGERLELRFFTDLRGGGAGRLAGASVMFAIGIAILALVAIPYHTVQSLYGFGRSWPEVAALLPRPGSFILASPSLIWPDLSGWFHYPAIWEQQLFPGFAAIIGIAWYLGLPAARRRNPLTTVMLTATGILLLATINVGGHSFYRLIYPIPGFSSMRVVSRVILVMMLPAAVLFGSLIDELNTPGTMHRRRCTLAVLLAIILIGECSLVRQDSSAPAAWRGRAEALMRQLPKPLPPGAILALKTPTIEADVTAWIYGQVDADDAAARLGIQTINGYSGNFPPTWKAPVTCAEIGDDLRAGRHFLAEHGMKAPRVRPGQLVLVGFPRCDAADLGRDPALEPGRQYRFAAGGDGNGFIADGFSGAEPWGRWTDARRAYLFFRLAALPPGPITVAVDGRSFSRAPNRRQAIRILANGRACGGFVLTDRVARGGVTCPAGAFRAGDNWLQFRIARPARPIDRGLGNDRRHIGLGLETLTIAAAR